MWKKHSDRSDGRVADDESPFDTTRTSRKFSTRGAEWVG